MKQKKSVKPKKQSDDSKDTAIAALVATVLALTCALAYFVVKTMPKEDSYASLYEHLLYNYIDASCRERVGQPNAICEVEKYGISNDGDPYAVFWHQVYDPETHQPVGEKVYHTLYFQHRDDAVNGYAEAMGD